MLKFNPDYKSRFRILKGGKISLVVSALVGSIAMASPSGGTLTSGAATINQTGSVTTINQSTNKASINWQDFSIASNETVNFHMPSTNSIVLNRVVGNEMSVINGALNANGQVWLLNSNGVLFGKSASVNTAGLLATTKDITNENFMNGNYAFSGESSASVINLGEITIADKGYAALVADSVKNEGIIRATLGDVHLKGASVFSLNLNGNSLINITVTKSKLDSLVENKGAIIADGGEIYLTTSAAEELMQGVVNNTGTIQANGMAEVNGKIVLGAYGGNVVNSAKLDTSSSDAKGGMVSVEADTIRFDTGSEIDTSGATGGGDIYVGGGWQGKDARFVNATDVEINRGTTINASGTQNGDAGTVVFWSDDAMRFAGDIIAKGGEISGDGGMVEVSGKEKLSFLGTVETSATNGKDGMLLLDPSTITIVNGSSGQTGTYSDWSDQTDSSTYVIPETVLESLSGNVVLTAVTDIIIENLADGELALSADNMYFYTNDESGGSSSGGFIMRDITDSIFLNKGLGHEIVFQGGNTSSLNGAPISSIYLGNVRTSGANVVFNTKRSSDASPMIVKGTITTNGGSITVTPGTRFDLTNSAVVDVQFDQLVSTSGGSFTSNMTGEVNINGGMNLGSGSATFGGTNTNINSVITSTSDVNINTPLNFGAGSGISTSGAVTFGGTANMLAGGDLTLTASNFVFNNTFSGNNAAITLKPYSASTNVDIGASSGTGAMVISSDIFSKLSNFRDVTVGRTDGTGTTTVRQNTSVTTSGDLEFINQNINVTGGTLANTSGGIILTGNTQNITNAVTSGSNRVTLQQLTNGATLGISGLNNINASTLAIGNAQTGAYIIASDQALHADTTTLHITSGSNITATAGGIAVANLALTSGGTIDLSDSAFNFSTLALSAANDATITRDGTYSIGSVDGVVGATTGGTLTLNNSGTTTQAQKITAPTLALSGGVFTLTNASNSINTLNSSTLANLSLLNSKALALSGVASSGKIDIATSTGDITLNGTLSASSTQSDAIVVNAGKSIAAGTATGGNIIYSSGDVTTGTGGRATLYTGDISASTGLTTLVGSSTGNFRYNSDEITTGYSTTNAPLEDGVYAIYREQPTIYIAPQVKTITYGDVDPTLTYASSGFANGDTNSILNGTASLTISSTKSASLNHTAGQHNILYSSGLTNDLGYAIADNAATNELTVNQKELTLTGATAENKIYDSNTDATMASYGTLGGIVSGDTVTLVTNSATATFSDKNAGENKTVNVAGLDVIGNDKDNYTATGSTLTALATITPKELTISGITAENKVYDGALGATVNAAGVTLLGLISGDDFTVASAGVFSDKNVGESKTVALSFGGDDISNYVTTSTSQASATANITRLSSVTWTGAGGDTNWFNPTNWEGGAIPDLANVANVIIPENVVVTFDTTGATGLADVSATVELESLGALGSLDMKDGSLDVVGATTLQGLTQSGGELVTNSLDVTENFGQTGAGTIEVTTDATIIQESGAIQLGNLKTGGTLDVTANGDITQLSDTTLDITGESTLASTTGDITLGEENDFKDKVTATAENITVQDINDLEIDVVATGDTTLDSGGNTQVEGITNDLDVKSEGTTTLGTLTASGDVEINANGDITQENDTTVTIEKTTTLVSANGDIILGETNNFKDTTNANAKNIALADTNELELGNIKAGGTFSVIANGDVTQALGTTIVSTGKVSVDAGKGAVALYNKGNIYKEAEFSGAGGVVTTKELTDQITAIVNSATVQTTEDFTQIQTPSVNIFNPNTLQEGKFNSGMANTFLSSMPNDEGTKTVTMSELITMQTEPNAQKDSNEDTKGATVSASNIKISMSETSIITLVGGGVKLPTGIEQEFYVADKD